MTKEFETESKHDYTKDSFETLIYDGMTVEELEIQSGSLPPEKVIDYHGRLVKARKKLRQAQKKYIQRGSNT